MAPATASLCRPSRLPPPPLSDWSWLVARQKLTPAGQMGLGAVAGLCVAVWARQPGSTLLLVAVGVVAAYVLSIWRQPMARTCRIPRVIGGCGGSNKVADGAGNWRPRRPCWRHPGGPPRRFGAILMGRARPEERL